LNDKWKYNEALKFNVKIYDHFLLTNDKQTINEYFNKLWTFHALAAVHETLFEKARVKASQLLKNIQREYNLTNQ
jgi:hypothetical protein